MFGPLSVLWICACSDQAIFGQGDNTGVRGVPDLAIWPEVLVFETSQVGGEPITEHLTIENVGEEVLAVDALDLTGSLAFDIEFEPFGLEPGDHLDVPVHFVPTAPENQAVVWVESNDPDAGRVTVELEGDGLVAALEVDPVVYDFGNASLGCVTEGTITLRSTGGVPVTVSDLVLAGERFYVNEHLPIHLDGYDEVDLLVWFAPEVAAAHEAELFVSHTAGEGLSGARITGQGNPILELEQVFWQGPFETTDIFVFVDRSGSMSDDAANLAQNFGTFADALNERDTNWQVGVVTQDTGCHNHAVFTPSTPNLEDRILAAVSTGGGTYTEAGLHVVANGLDAACNSSLMRDGARRAVIYLSDEPDQSPLTWESYLVDMWASSPSIVTHAIVEPDNPQGYEDITLATGGLVLDITDDWGADLADVAAETVGEKLEVFELAEPADPDSVEVTVDGVPTTAWTLSDDQMWLVFDKDSVPASGTEIVVTYTSGDTCSW